MMQKLALAVVCLATAANADLQKATDRGLENVERMGKVI